MVEQQRTHDSDVGGSAFILGIFIALLFAIPLWAAIGVGAILLFQDEPFTTGQTAALLAAAGIEAILLRYAWRAFRPQLGLRGLLARALSARPTRPVLKQTAWLGGLVVAYLHYYFWDVQLQIAVLNKVTVFI
jgi:hypothetical protein